MDFSFNWRDQRLLRRSEVVQVRRSKSNDWHASDNSNTNFDETLLYDAKEDAINVEDDVTVIDTQRASNKRQVKRRKRFDPGEATSPKEAATPVPKTDPQVTSQMRSQLPQPMSLNPTAVSPKPKPQPVSPTPKPKLKPKTKSPGSARNWMQLASRGIQRIIDTEGETGVALYFKEPVNEEYAPGYYDEIDDPIDLGAMIIKLQKRSYKVAK
jgi:hypothetical protein